MEPSQLAEFKTLGYTVLRAVHDQDSMAGWRSTQDYLESTALRQHGKLVRTNPSSKRTLESRIHWFDNMLERTPEQMWAACANSRILDALEAIVGPFAQIDNFTLAAFPSEHEKYGLGGGISVASGFHRDRYSHLPRGYYETPSAVNAIWYLQDLTNKYGPLRVIPRSHVQPVTIDPESRSLPHPNEVLVHMKAGDVVLVHNGLIHSGTPNTSGNKRYFQTVFYNCSWMKQTDTFEGPNCQLLKNLAERHHDHRALRLLGVDHQLEQRVNSGFQEPDEVSWSRWILEDKAQLKGDMLANMTVSQEERLMYERQRL